MFVQHFRCTIIWEVLRSMGWRLVERPQVRNIPFKLWFSQPSAQPPALKVGQQYRSTRSILGARYTSAINTAVYSSH